MTLEVAKKTIESRGITAWMAWGILRENNEFVIVPTSFIKKFPNKDYLYIRKGSEFPKEPLYERKQTFLY
jgi:hypothetical protein